MGHLRSIAEATGLSDWLLRVDMSDFKALMCILVGVALVMCAIFYGFLFYIYPDATSTFAPTKL